MRLALFNPKARAEELERKRNAGEILLRLWEDDMGVVFLVATDEYGSVLKDCMLLRINPNGTFSRLGGVSMKLGLPLTDGQKVIVE